MSNEQCLVTPLALLRLQSWLSPVFPIGSYSYSHGLEWATEAGDVYNRESLIDWLDADLCYGSGRNEAIFLCETWRFATTDDRVKLLQVAELAAAFRATSEFALESAQQATASLTTIGRVWPDAMLEWLSEVLRRKSTPPTLGVVLGLCSARQGIPLSVALPLFLHSYITNLVTAAVRLIPLGQTDGQLAIASLENAVLAASSQANSAGVDDLGSVALMVDFASMAHESQYTRVFRS